MKEIKLSQFGKSNGKYLALIDDEDFERVNKFKWAIRKHRNTFYATRAIFKNEKQINISMHSFIFGDKYIDHKDHNGLNNQKSNLRKCTVQQNNRNRQISIHTSVYKGVHKVNNRFIAKIYVNRKYIHIGSFIYEIDAAKAYNQKAIELFKEFAYLNKV